MKYLIPMVVGLFVIAGCQKKEDGNDSATDQTDAGDNEEENQTENLMDLPALNLNGAIGLAVQGTSAKLALTASTPNLKRIDQDGTVTSAFDGEDSPSTVNKILSGPNGKVYVLFNEPPCSGDCGGAVETSGDDPEAKESGGDPDAKSAPKLRLDEDEPGTFAWLAEANKDDGQLKWLDSRLRGLTPSSNGLVQFDSNGSVYFIGKVEGVGGALVQIAEGQKPKDLHVFAEGDSVDNFIITDDATSLYALTGSGINQLDLNSGAEKTIFDGTFSSIRASSNGTLVWSAFEEGLKKFDPKTATVSDINLTDLCDSLGMDQESCPNQARSIWKYGDKLIAEWGSDWSAGIITVYPTVEVFVQEPAGSPVHVLDDSRVILASQTDSPKLYVVENGTQTELNIQPEMEKFERFSHNAAGDLLIFTGIRKSDGKDVVGKYSFANNAATVEVVDVPLDDLQGL